MSPKIPAVVEPVELAENDSSKHAPKKSREKFRERGEGGLFQRAGSAVWYAQIYRDGKPIRQSTRTENKQEAIAFLQAMQDKVRQGMPTAAELGKFTYADLRALLLGDYRRQGNRSLQTMADGEETIWGLGYLDEFFGFPAKPWPLTKINGRAAAAFRDARRADVRAKAKKAGNEVNEFTGNAVVNRSLALLRRMLQLAHEDDGVNGINLPTVPVIKKFPEPPARDGFITEKQFPILLANVATKFQPLIQFLFDTGVRIGEATQIEWKQIDLATRVVSLKSTQTKNKTSRRVPLSPAMVTYLNAVPSADRHGLVFDADGLRIEWERATKAAGFEGLLVHDLRRSAVREMVRSGVPEKNVMQISGHKTRAVFDRYDIGSEDDIQEAMRLRMLKRNNDTAVAPPQQAITRAARKALPAESHAK
jgi:integrase